MERFRLPPPPISPGIRLGLAALLPALLPMVGPPRPVELVVVTAITAEGRATADWLAILRQRLSPERYDSVAPLQRVMTPDQRGWESLIRSRARRWETMAEPLTGLYRPARAPKRVRIVLGNRGSEDAFTAGPETIGFDLSSLFSVYGSSGEAVNLERIDRFFRHEFNHILQKAWLAQHPWADSSPLGQALLDTWSEGLGNYFSLSGQWLDPNRRLSELGTRTLQDLEPRFAERLRGLACADRSAAGPLLAGLSSGPFPKKWGAVSAALWLATEPGPIDSALRRVIQAGPAGVWDLADRHIAASLRPALREARTAAQRCAGKAAADSTERRIPLGTPGDTGSLPADLYGSGPSGVILIAHGGYSSRPSWTELARLLADSGFRVLVFDTRGAVALQAGQETACLYEAPCMARDVLAAARYLRAAGARSLAVIGGSAGGGAAEQAAIEEPEAIDRLVLLAPMSIDSPARLQTPKLVVVGRGDLGPGDRPRLPEIQAQYAQFPGTKELMILEESAHGQRLLQTGSKDRLMVRLIQFLRGSRSAEDHRTRFHR